MSRPTHAAHGDTPMLPDYDYDTVGRGVRSDLVDAGLEALAAISPWQQTIARDEAAAQVMKSVNDGYINEVRNLARIVAYAVASRTTETLPVPDLNCGGNRVVPAGKGRYYSRWISVGRATMARCNCGWAGPARTDEATATADLAGHEVH